MLLKRGNIWSQTQFSKKNSNSLFQLQIRKKKKKKKEMIDQGNKQLLPLSRKL